MNNSHVSWQKVLRFSTDVRNICLSYSPLSSYLIACCQFIYFTLWTVNGFKLTGPECMWHSSPSIVFSEYIVLNELDGKQGSVFGPHLSVWRVLLMFKLLIKIWIQLKWMYTGQVFSHGLVLTVWAFFEYLPQTDTGNMLPILPVFAFDHHHLLPSSTPLSFTLI